MAASTQQRIGKKRTPAKGKQTRKPSAKKQTGRKQTTAKKQTRKSAPVRRSTLPVSDRDRKTAEKATTQMRMNVRGEGKRAPVNATQVALVRSKVGGKSVATIAKQLGFGSQAELKRHASGSLEKMPDGASAKLTEFARGLGDGPGASKIRGRKLTAIVANL